MAVPGFFQPSGRMPPEGEETEHFAAGRKKGWGMANGKRIAARVILTVLTLGVMIMIFVFSSEDGAASNETSGIVTRTVLKIARPDYEQQPENIQNEIFQTVQFFVRKTAHFTEYLMLGFLLRLCLESWFAYRHLTLWSWLGATVYAGTDELHQLIGGERTAMWQDVALDGVGAFAGVLFAFVVVILLYRHEERRK